jgi:predicted metalloprotease with PDZ domain
MQLQTDHEVFMRFSTFIPSAVAVCAAASSIGAQAPRITRIGPGAIVGGGAGGVFESQPRAVIGIGTTSAASSRDTLGVLVSTVRPGSPAEKAGIEEGNRIGSINGVSLTLSAADIGDEQMANVLSRRLNRELDKLRPGDEVDLRVFASGQTKSIKVKTIAPEDLYATASSSRRNDDERATLGINIGVTGTSRDTIGIFVMGVEDGSPAAKAGIEEGSRIATINGVDVRGKDSRDTDRDGVGFFQQPTNLNRLEREMARVKPGDDVDLRVFYNNQFKNVKVKAGRPSDIPRRRGSVTIMRGGDDAMALPRGQTRIDTDQFGDQFRKAMEGLRINAGRMGLGNRTEW